MTLFEKIIAREIPADVILEDDNAIVIRDVKPQAPVHLLVIPKRPIARLAAATELDGDLLGKLLLAASVAARQCRIDDTGYRIVINSGKDAGETVPHLHLHVLGGRALDWPPG